MNKKDWEDALKRAVEGLENAKKNLVVAKTNVEIIEGQVEERELVVAKYKEKIKTFL